MTNEKYQFQIFLPYKGIAHGISSKAFMSMKRMDDGQIDRAALKSFAKALDILDPVITMHQIHSGNVTNIHSLWKKQIADTDAMITNKQGIPLAVLTADCLPLLFYDPKQNVIAVAHAGYKGLLNHVIGNTVQRLVRDYKCKPENILVGIGPSIERDCYEVGKDRIEEFKKAFPTFEKMFIEREGRYYLDLRSVAQQCLAKEGILKEHIEVMDICTKCDPNFYSYRGGEKNNRFASIISLRYS